LVLSSTTFQWMASFCERPWCRLPFRTSWAFIVAPGKIQTSHFQILDHRVPTQKPMHRELYCNSMEMGQRRRRSSSTNTHPRPPLLSSPPSHRANKHFSLLNTIFASYSILKCLIITNFYFGPAPIFEQTPQLLVVPFPFVKSAAFVIPRFKIILFPFSLNPFPRLSIPKVEVAVTLWLRLSEISGTLTKEPCPGIFSIQDIANKF